MEPPARGPIVCDLTQIPADRREEFFRRTSATFSRARAALELNDGFALEFPNEHGLMASLGEFIEYDRRCCPFIRHVLSDEAWGGTIRLELTGPPEARALLADELRRIVPRDVGLFRSEL